MAARRTRRKTTRRRRSQGVNVLNAAQSYIVASATTKAFFGTDLIPFLTEGWLTSKTPGAQGGAGNSWTLSAAELATGLMGGGLGQSGQSGYDNGLGGLSLAIRKNLKANGGKAIMTAIAVPVAFNVVKKITAKPRRDTNKLLKMAGLSSVVKV